VRHFSDERWADLARNLVPAKEKAVMEQHLNTGCEKCTAAFRTWQNVCSVAQGEVEFTPPADAIRLAKSRFVPAASRDVRLVFDSMLQPATAGIRGALTARQFLYETDDYYIDLRFEPRAETERACLVGQLLRRSGPDRVAQGVAIRLQDGKSAVAQTSTNEFGEFLLEFEAANSMSVSIGHDEMNEIILPLYGIQAKSMIRKDLD